MADHNLLGLGGIHRPYNWVYADATARNAATGFVSTDVGKLCLQQDTNELYILTATTPTWVSVGGQATGYISSILGEYRIDANTYTAPPSSGYIRYNNATQTSATNVFIHDVSHTGVDTSLFFGLLKVGARFIIQDKDDHANIQIFEISSAPVDNTTYFTIPVTLLSSNGTGTTGFVNNHNVFAAAFNPETDEKAKVSANDTTSGYLNGKLVAGSNITLTENNDGGNETLTIAASVPAGYTDEEAQDAVGNILLDSATIDFTYSDGTPSITADVIQSAIDHGSISGLGDDDHTQYHNDTRADTWLGTKSTTDLAEGTNLYFTDERVDDRVASLLAQGSRMNLSYNDGANTLTVKSVDTEYKTLTIGEGTDELLVNTRGKFMFVPENYTITGWRLHEASETPISGSVVIDIRTGTTYAGSSSIAGTEKPTLSSANNNSDTSLSSWTTSLTSGSFVWFNIDSVTDCKKVVLTLEMVKV